MKKILSILIALAGILSFAACKQNEGNKATTLYPEESEDSNYSVRKHEGSQRIKQTKVIVKDDYVKLTVKFPKTIKQKEHFVLKATVKNISDKDIRYTIPNDEKDTHQEIRIKFPSEKGKSFTDTDTFGRIMIEVVGERQLKAGDTFVEKINFAPGALYTTGGTGLQDGKDVYYEPGEYPATASFSYISPETGEYVMLSEKLNFVITDEVAESAPDVARTTGFADE